MNRSLPLLLFTCFLALSNANAQESDRPDNAGRARPRLDKDALERVEPRPYLLSLPGAPAPSPFFFNQQIVDEGSSVSPQVESSIAVNALSPMNLIASAVDYRSGLGALIVYVSSDGGRTWKSKDLGTIRTGWSSGNDPSVAFDHRGYGYLMYGGFPAQRNTGESGVYVSRTTDNGANWTTHHVVIEHVGTMTKDSAFEDKYYIQPDRSASSPYRGYLYTPWKRVTDRDSATQIVFTRSTDAGLTWSVPIGVSPRKPGTSTDTTFGQSFPISATGPDGTVYVAWNDGPIRSIGFSRSSDAGATFTPATYPVSGYPTLGTARTVGAETYHVLKGTFRAETYPTMAVDISNSPRRGNLYLAWAAGTTPDVYFMRSTDKGATWSQPKLIHSDIAGDQWWPWLNVDETNGDIAVVYNDSRHDPANIAVDAYISYSSDGGDTWIDRRATDVQSDYRRNPFTNQIFMGDYNGIAFHDGMIYPSFDDTRNANNDVDIYTSIVDIHQPYPVEDFKARVDPDTLQNVVLTWRNPALQESVFGKPIAAYELVIDRGGAGIATVPGGTTRYVDRNLTIGQTHAYSIRVATTTDTSVERKATVLVGGSPLPARPVIASKSDFASHVELGIRLPSFRADSVTPLANLRLLRVYRDGELIREETLDRLDTGRLIPIADTPSARGYYRYTATVVDAATPPHESAAADTIIAYVGELTAYSERFDGARDHLLRTGTWDITTSIALSPPGSMTDSPGGTYRPRDNSYLQLYPVLLRAPIELRFAHIAIVDPGGSTTGDTAFVEVSYDRGANWNLIERYTWSSDPRWSDTAAEAGDWREEMHVIRPQSGSTDSVAIVRFRLKTNISRQYDGWYLDNIQFGSIAGVERRDEGVGLVATARPNPFGAATMIEFNLPQRDRVRLRVVDVVGREVVRLVDEVLDAGAHTVPFVAGELPAGAYIYELSTTRGVVRGGLVRVR